MCCIVDMLSRSLFIKYTVLNKETILSFTQMTYTLVSFQDLFPVIVYLVYKDLTYRILHCFVFGFRTLYMTAIFVGSYTRNAMMQSVVWISIIVEGCMEAYSFELQLFVIWIRLEFLIGIHITSSFFLFDS